MQLDADPQSTVSEGGCETLETDDRPHLLVYWVTALLPVRGCEVSSARARARACACACAGHSSLRAHHALFTQPYASWQLTDTRHPRSRGPGRSHQHEICVCPSVSLALFVPSPSPFSREASAEATLAPRFHSQCNASTRLPPSRTRPLFVLSGVLSQTRNFTSRSRHLLPKSRHSARPAGAKPNAVSQAEHSISSAVSHSLPSSSSTLPRNWKKGPGPFRPA
jgi:hypothetical protein